MNIHGSPAEYGKAIYDNFKKQDREIEQEFHGFEEFEKAIFVKNQTVQEVREQYEHFFLFERFIRFVTNHLYHVLKQIKVPLRDEQAEWTSVKNQRDTIINHAMAVKHMIIEYKAHDNATYESFGSLLEAYEAKIDYFIGNVHAGSYKDLRSVYDDFVRCVVTELKSIVDKEIDLEREHLHSELKLA